jgi:hypothetical protein
VQNSGMKQVVNWPFAWQFSKVLGGRPSTHVELLLF